jgi:hypothetical protein
MNDGQMIWPFGGDLPFFPLQPAKHDIQIKGKGKTGQYIFFDDLKSLSAASIYGPDCGKFPSMGEANGEDPRGGLDAFVNSLHSEINWTTA